MIVAGAMHHALEILDLLFDNDIKSELYFFDDITEVNIFQKYFKVIKTIDELKLTLKKNNQFILGVGSPRARKILYEKCTCAGGELIGIRSKRSYISPSAKVSNKADILMQCLVHSMAEIGDGTLINSGCQIHHEVKVGRFCEISPGAKLLGNVEIGEECSIGSGSIILPQVRICDGVIIGAGAVVTKNITEVGTYVGVPAKKI